MSTKRYGRVKLDWAAIREAEKIERQNDAAACMLCDATPAREYRESCTGGAVLIMHLCAACAR